MSEVIRAILEADSTDLQAELKKASAAVESFENKARRARDIGSPTLELSPAYLRQMDQAAAITGKMQASMRGLGGGAGNAAAGMLQLAQFADDAQYGLRGVLNNIPGLVMGFGGGMGLAGAVSLGALAISRIIPLWEKLNGTADDEALRNAAKTWDEVYSNGMKAAAAIREAADAEREAASLASEWSQALDSRFEVGSQMDGFYDGALAAAREERDLTLEILKAREAALRATGGDTSGVSSKIASVEATGAEADLANRREALAQVEGELLSLIEKRKILAAETAAGEIASTEALVAAKQNLARYEADLAANEKLRASIKPLSGLGAEAAEAVAPLAKLGAPIGFIGKSALAEKAADQATLKNLATDAAIYRQEIEKLRAEIAALESEAAARGPAASGKLQELDAAIQKRDGETRAIMDQVKALETLTKQQTALNEIEAQRAGIAAEQSTLAALKKEAPKLEQKAQEAAAQDAAADSLLDELEILRAQVTEGKAKADQLREEAALRERVAQIVKETALSSDDARAVAEEQLKLQKALAAPAAPTGSIRERREARSAERAAERERKRNERVAEAERKRKERREKDGDENKQEQVDIDALRRETERKKQDADKAVKDNSAKQAKSLERIEKRLELLEKITSA